MTSFFDPLELIASILGAISVWLIVKRNVWGFPIGIVMVILYIAIFFKAKFYSDMILQFVYIIMQAMGWYEWNRSDRDKDDRIKILQLSPQQWQATIGIQIVGSLAIGYSMDQFTDAALPYVDAFTTTMSLLAQWWMNKKYLENWLLWIAVDMIYLYQYSTKSLYLTTALYAVFLVMAIIGYREWKDKVNGNQRLRNDPTIIDNF